jgi:hypothetical protein
MTTEPKQCDAVYDHNGRQFRCRRLANHREQHMSDPLDETDDLILVAWDGRSTNTLHP